MIQVFIEVGMTYWSQHNQLPAVLLYLWRLSQDGEGLIPPLSGLILPVTILTGISMPIKRAGEAHPYDEKNICFLFTVLFRLFAFLLLC